MARKQPYNVGHSRDYAIWNRWENHKYEGFRWSLCIRSQ